MYTYKCIKCAEESSDILHHSHMICSRGGPHDWIQKPIEVSVPTGIGGKKFDTGKLRWDLLPYDAVEDIVAVLTFGARKYDDDNWKYVTPAKPRYFAATMRHLVAWFGGEKLDKETGINHLAHAACCILFLLWGDKKVESETTQT